MWMGLVRHDGLRQVCREGPRLTLRLDNELNVPSKRKREEEQ